MVGILEKSDMPTDWKKKTNYRQLPFEKKGRRPGFKIKFVPLVISVFGGGIKEISKELENMFQKGDLCEKIVAETQKSHSNLTTPVFCLVFFFLSGFSFTNIHDSQDSRGRKGGGISLTPLYYFHPLYSRLLQRAHLCTWLAAGLEPGTFSFRAQVANH